MKDTQKAIRAIDQALALLEELVAKLKAARARAVKELS